jgi:putative transposase
VAGTFTNLLYHVVFSTKDRQALIPAALRAELDKYIGGILHNQGGILLEIGGMPDHIHIVAKLPADRSVSEMVRLIKANSSKWVNERTAPAVSFGWQSGYGAFSVSASQLEDVRGYVRRQEEHHRVRTFREEFVEFLKWHEIAYDERYLWD